MRCESLIELTDVSQILQPRSAKPCGRNTAQVKIQKSCNEAGEELLPQLPEALFRGQSTQCRLEAYSGSGCTALGNGIVNKPCQAIAYDWSKGGATIASTSYTYDGSTPIATSGTPQHISVSGSRGNLTTVATQASSGATLYRQFTYYDTGMPNNSTDVDTSSATTCSSKPGICTTYNYSSASASCGNAFPTSLTEPMGLSRSMTWNCSGAVTAQVTDENGNNVSSKYTDPDFWRPASVTDQLNNQSNLTYIGHTAVEGALQNFNGGNSASDSRTTVDGFGRPIFSQRLQAPGGTNYDTVETDYNNVGQPYRFTMPYTATASPSSPNNTVAATTKTYDALGRVLTITDADGGTISYTYTNNDVLQQVSGSQTFQKQFEYDGLGRLTSVCEISATLPGVGTCAQKTSQTGYWTKYSYDALGRLLTVTQNAQAASGSQQNRTFAYDMLGRMTSESNPEIGNNGANGTVTYSYDSVSPCADGTNYSYPGNLVQKKDNAGNYTCYKYDYLHRITQAGNTSASNTTLRKFFYDSETSYPTGVTVTNGKTRMVEAQTVNTSNLNTVLTDEFFSYDARGEMTDVYESTPHSSGYYHTTASYWPTGMVKALSGIPGVPTIYYGASTGVGLDGEGRVTQVTASSGTNPVTGVSYSPGTSAPLGALTSVTFGSADSDAFTYDPNTGRMATYTFAVNGKTDVGTLIWNTNGTLQKLAINDQIPGTHDSQTCTYAYDDVQRLSNVTCGSLWVQNFTYDPFGNITKNVPGGDGGLTFLPSYWTTPPTNQFTSLPGISSPYYDANGNLIKDNLNTYTWDPNWGTMLTVNTGSATVTATYDALGRMVENNAGGTWTEFVYGPTGKLAKCNGQTLSKALIALPGGAKAVYNSSGLVYFRHSDWLGSSRLTSTATKPTSMYSSAAYAPFGEQYATAGTSDASYTGQDSDTVSTLYDFLARRQSPTQGRWISPDPAGRAAVTLTNPQSWNRYAYVKNNPMSLIDPAGMKDENSCSDDDDNCNGDDDDNGGGNGDDNSSNCDYDACVTATDPGSAPNVCDEQCQLTNAEWNAFTALLNPTCANFIGLGGQAANTLMTMMKNSMFRPPDKFLEGPTNGTISAQPFFDPTGRDMMPGTAAGTYSSDGPASIFINTAGDFFVGQAAGDYGVDLQTYQAATILHELGHAIADNGGVSGIIPDSENDWGDPIMAAAASDDNESNVVKNCFGGGNQAN